MKFAVRTDIGKHRELNEDFYSIIPGKDGRPDIFIIADGMGGHNSGEIASKAAVDFIGAAAVNPEEGLSAGCDIEGRLRSLIAGANRHVYEKSLELAANNGMGTTLTVAVAAGDTMYIGHVGDSRIYMVRKGEIKLLTTDHSYIEEMIRNGSLTREEARKHPRKNVITRALGCAPELEADFYAVGMEEGDIFIMCTDGLTNMLAEEEIASVAEKNTPEAACGILVDKANENGGEDNITVIVIKNE